MKPLDFPLLLDENIPARLATLLRDRGFDVRTVAEAGLAGVDDTPILELASSQKWVLVTQDRDFGRLAFLTEAPYFGILYLRPASLYAEEILQSLLALNERQVQPPFYLIARRDAEGSIRVRSKAPD